MERKNCWEFVKCGREKNCPAYPNLGRACFAVTATKCRGGEQGTFDEKIKQCRESCAFYRELMDGSE